MQLWQTWQDNYMHDTSNGMPLYSGKPGAVRRPLVVCPLHSIALREVFKLPVFLVESLGTNEARLACLLHGLLSGAIVAIWCVLCTLEGAPGKM